MNNHEFYEFRYPFLKKVNIILWFIRMKKEMKCIPAQFYPPKKIQKNILIYHYYLMEEQ